MNDFISINEYNNLSEEDKKLYNGCYRYGQDTKELTFYGLTNKLVKSVLPQDNKQVLGWYKAYDGKMQPCIVRYTKGWDLEVDSDGEEENVNFDEKSGLAFMPEGWYEMPQQRNGFYDEIYIKRDIIKWQHIPILD